jgi:uncharacterized protein DUF3347
MKNQLAVFALVFVSFASYAQHDHAHASNTNEKVTPVFQDEKMGAAYKHYIHLKDALVASNADEAKKAAKELEASLTAITTGKKAAEVVNKISASSNINEQRKSFSDLSNEMTTLVKASKLASGSLYIEYCPMANHNEGAFWLSNEKEIKNPYFGNMMLNCGSVRETLQ